MANLFLTSAAISLHKEPPLEVLPALPSPPATRPLIHGCLTVATGMACAVVPAAVPVLLGVLAGWHLWQGFTAAARERRQLRAVARLSQRAAAQMGQRHPLVRMLGRYHRLLLRVSAEAPNVTGWRVSVRRRALLQRLAHRCQSMLDEWPLFADAPRVTSPGPLLPAPRSASLVVVPRSRIVAVMPSTALTAPVLVGPMLARSRRRRGLRPRAY